MTRMRMSDCLFNGLSAMADELKMYWFYDDYIRRRTVDIEDVLDIMDGWDAYPEKDVLSGMLTQEVREAFDEARRRGRND